MSKRNKPPLKVVKKERQTRRPEPEAIQRDWVSPTAHFLELDKARLAHWWAQLNGGDTVKTLKAWAALLHVPRTRVKA